VQPPQAQQAHLAEIVTLISSASTEFLVLSDHFRHFQLFFEESFIISLNQLSIIFK
jgi:hypothetical protein